MRIPGAASVPLPKTLAIPSGAPERYASDETRLSYANALALSVNRYFSTNTSWSDETKPTVSLLTSGSVAPQNGQLAVSFSASDAGGLACALLRVDGNTVDEMALSGTAASKTFLTPWYTPGTAHEVTVSVWDSQGNLQNATSTVTPLSTANRAPRPQLRVSPSCVAPGQSVTLDASASTAPDHASEVLKVEWDLDGNGSFDTAAGTAKSYTTSFASPGFRLIRVRVTDPAGAQSVSTPIALRVQAAPSGVGGWELY